MWWTLQEPVKFLDNCFDYKWGRRDNAVVRALASHRCGLGSIPGPGVTCGLSLLLVLIPAPRVFLWVLRFSSLHKNQHSKFQFDLELRATGLSALLLLLPSLNKVNLFIIFLSSVELSLFYKFSNPVAPCCKKAMTSTTVHPKSSMRN